MKSITGSTNVMKNMNKEMNPAEIMSTMKEFSKEMEKAGIQGEMMQDAFEMAEDPSANAEADDVYNGILGEIGLEYTGGVAVPTSKLAAP